MPRMTFTSEFTKDLNWFTSIHYFPEQTYDVPDDLVAEVTAAGAAAPEVVAIAAKPVTAPVKDLGANGAG